MQDSGVEGAVGTLTPGTDWCLNFWMGGRADSLMAQSSQCRTDVPVLFKEEKSE